MPTPSLALRLVISQQDDVGAAPSKGLDESLTLSGLEDLTPGRRVRLAPAAADVALAFTAAAGLVIVSHDHPFSLRIAAGETLLENLRFFVIGADSIADAAVSTSVLLTGNGDNTADLEVWVAEQVE